MVEAKIVAFPQTDEQDHARAALRLLQHVARRAAPASRLLAPQPDVANALGFNVRTIREATRALEGTGLFEGRRQGNDGVMYRLLAPVAVIAQRLGITEESTGSRSEPRSEPGSDPIRTSIRTSADVRARESTTPTTPPTDIGSPDLRSDPNLAYHDEISLLTYEGRLDLMGMGNAPEFIVSEFADLTDDQQRYCIAAVEAADPPTTNWRFLQPVMRSARNPEARDRIRASIGLAPIGRAPAGVPKAAAPSMTEDELCALFDRLFTQVFEHELEGAS